MGLPQTLHLEPAKSVSMEPRVSIVMPVLNGKRFIAEAIASIVAQTYRNYELVLVDDGSTDGTHDEVERFLPHLTLTYVCHTENQGIARSVNDGISKSSGELIAFLDHDDSWLPNFLETQIGYLQQHPDVGMVHSDFQTTDVDGNVLEASVFRCRNLTAPTGYIFPRLFMSNGICANTVLIRRECLTRFGGFDQRLHWGDYHLWLRIARHYKIGFVPQVLTRYRQHAMQSTQECPMEEPVGLQAVRYILDEYPEIFKELGRSTVRRRMASFYFDSAYIWLAKGAPERARAALRKAIRLWPLEARYYLLFLASMLRSSDLLALRTRWSRFRASM